MDRAGQARHCACNEVVIIGMSGLDNLRAACSNVDMPVSARVSLITAIAAGALLIPSVSGAAGATPAKHTPDPVATALAKMTLQQKVGQLFVTYAYGDTADTADPQYTSQNQTLYGVDNGAQLVDKYNLGGVIYFTWAGNLASPTQIATLSNGLQTAASTGPTGVPLLVSTDQEGGSVTRIAAPLAISPGNMALGASFSPKTAFDMSRVTGQQLKALGINVDDAPVVDTNTNAANTADGPRSFGDQAVQTSLLGASSVLGYKSAGIATTAKHFPGLGSTSVNTDFGEAISTETKAQFFANDIPAFRAAIAAGTDEIMAAHIVASSLDPTGTPASLSYPIVTGILRNQLHYNGVVVTDALSAAALHNYPDAERSVDAIKAGIDELLMPTDLAASVQAVTAAVQSGEISQQRLDQSVTRLLRLKQKLGLFSNAQVDASKAATSVGTGSQLATMNGAAHSAMNLLRNTAGTLPWSAGTPRSVLVTGWGATTTQGLADALTAKGATTSRVYTGSAPSAAAIAAAVTAAKAADDTVVLTDNAWGDQGQRDLVTALQATGKPVIVVAVGAPYELGYLPDTPTFLAAYGYQPASVQAIADVLYGAQPTGHLPVTIRSADGSTVVAKFGAGLRYPR
jgi:beta-N-acetylhexosaminidase